MTALPTNVIHHTMPVRNITATMMSRRVLTTSTLQARRAVDLDLARVVVQDALFELLPARM